MRFLNLHFSSLHTCVCIRIKRTHVEVSGQVCVWGGVSEIRLGSSRLVRGAEPLCLLNYSAGYPITLVTLSMAKNISHGNYFTYYSQCCEKICDKINLRVSFGSQFEGLVSHGGENMAAGTRESRSHGTHS